MAYTTLVRIFAQFLFVGLGSGVWLISYTKQVLMIINLLCHKTVMNYFRKHFYFTAFDLYICLKHLHFIPHTHKCLWTNTNKLVEAHCIEFRIFLISQNIYTICLILSSHWHLAAFAQWSKHFNVYKNVDWGSNHLEVCTLFLLSLSNINMLCIWIEIPFNCLQLFIIFIFYMHIWWAHCFYLLV